ncbi:hypothetical protein EFK50_18915 [Nocardioides marmoriginsengisoli]|uniref:Uncharacterized protein n=1 Tax=Nocardioides marmoriginsengisoli TaxID=661483 RepID=A0A3N0CAC6_9ACTN|nr:hypothetical protein [Nocardioides marmoriginsengisoli]RNL60410.1 hypothetical protein EFK50_18915 [Nocardioides marmoriginsengisoli]
MNTLEEQVDVTTWDGDATAAYHDEVWSAWLHGSVAAVHDAGRLLLLVPVAILTPAAIALALRLYKVGAVTVLD